ncbi:YadA-like family protein [Haemophilus influenzae]|uniref:YadA-like family protein n=1 Tax=Haemophilus influenzae TaxID=727 RepID=UPI000D4A2C80|nr:YadA-like family protein [Haemophilus influenzae]PRK20290.1 hypothetical protein BV201_01698 [Haemophilus influenzae]
MAVAMATYRFMVLSNTVKGASSQVFGQGNNVYGVYHTVSGYYNEVGKDSNQVDDNSAVNYTVALGYHAKTLGNNAVAIGVGYTPKANITLKSGIAVNAGKNSKISYQMGADWVW